MSEFTAPFLIVEERSCPYYNLQDGFILTGQSVELPFGSPACLILLRELTGLLFTLSPHKQTDFGEYKKMIFTCGGCTGLIKFSLTEQAPVVRASSSVGVEGKNDGAVMSGQIDAILPAELLQIFHMHQKTGRLVMELGGGVARVTFREGGLLAARFNDLDNQEAIYAILSQEKGDFRFIPGLPDSLMQAREIGDFMMILMEGLKRLDEEE